jgi:hypothetical protein
MVESLSPTGLHWEAAGGLTRGKQATETFYTSEVTTGIPFLGFAEIGAEMYFKWARHGTLRMDVSVSHMIDSVASASGQTPSQTANQSEEKRSAYPDSMLFAR